MPQIDVVERDYKRFTINDYAWTEYRETTVGAQGMNWLG